MSKVNRTVLHDSVPTVTEFSTGGTVRTKNDLFKNNAGVWQWCGSVPKSIPKDSTPESTGGTGASAWVNLTDTQLRTDLSTSSGASLIGSSNGSTVQSNLDTLNTVSHSSAVGKLSNARVLVELPNRPEKEYKELIAQYKYHDVYPQGMYMYEGILYINNSGYGANATNNWDWIYAYDMSTWELKSVFSAGNQNAEGLVLYRYNNELYMFILEQYSLKGQGKTGVYKLPADLSSVYMQRLTPIKTQNTYHFYQIGGFKNKVVIEVNYGHSDANVAQRRSKFVYYDAVDLITKDNPKPIGAFSLDPSVVKTGNPQGIGISDTGVLTQHAGYYYQPSFPVNQNTMYTVNRHTYDGTVIDSFACRADEFINTLRPHVKINPTRLEGQGILYYEGGVYTFNVLGDPASANEYKGGVVILEHNLNGTEEGVIDLSQATYPLGVMDYGNDVNYQVQTIAVDRSTNTPLYSLKDILDSMLRDSVNVYEFYNTGFPLVKDTKGNELPWGVLVSIHNLDSKAFSIRVTGNRMDYTLHVTVSGGVYTQTYSTTVQVSDTNLRPEFYGAPRKVQGVDGSVREDVYTNSNGRAQAFRFIAGTTDSSSRAVGAIMIDGGANKTEYLTTSDTRLKIAHGVTRYMPELVQAAVQAGAAQYAAFKTDPSTVYPMCMAQVLSKYFPEAVYVGSGTDDPWMVDSSKLVPALMIAVAQLSSTVEELKKAVGTTSS